MKTLIKLAIAAAIINAAARSGMAALDYYRLRDEAQQLITFGGGESTSELHSRILARAAELHVPLQPERLDVQRDGTRTSASASYTQPIEFFPRFTYPVDWSFSVEAFSLRPAAAGDPR